MAVREFTDAGGRVWQVWPVTPEQLQPRTAAEDYLGDYGEGWLVFESANERRRLASYPANWEELPETELRNLLDRAAVVKQRRRFGLDDVAAAMDPDAGDSPSGEREPGA